MENYFVQYKPSALDDLSKIRAYIAKDSLEQADRWIDLLEDRCKNLADFPMLGKLYKDDRRLLVVNRGYRIYYRVDEANKSVVVLHFFSPYQDASDKL